MNKKRVILIDLVAPSTGKEEAEDHLTEIISLIHTYRDGDIIKIIQRRSHPHPATYVGTGKADEISNIIKDEHIDIVIINGIVRDVQLFRLTRMWWSVNDQISVWDRVDLILHIFQKHASTAEAKLQISLAQMRHMGPRMYGLSEQLGRQSGGIGGRGIGETNIELMKRHWRQAIHQTTEKLGKIETIKQRQIDVRKSHGCKTAAIVGYTNAGKTTLFNRLTNKHKRSQDVLFATLDSTMGKVYIPQLRQSILISDTIGFIQDLPPELIEAFKSTLLASVHADIIIHVADLADTHLHDKVRIVDGILHDLAIDTKPQILIFNKSDILDQESLNHLKSMYAERNPVFCSSTEGDLDEIITTLSFHIPMGYNLVHG